MKKKQGLEICLGILSSRQYLDLRVAGHGGESRLVFDNGAYDLVGIFGIFTILVLRYASDYYREKKNGKIWNSNGTGKALNEILGQLKGIRASQMRVENILTTRGLDQTLSDMNADLRVILDRTKGAN